MRTYLNENDHYAHLAEVQMGYGAGRAKCALCERVRPLEDLASWWVGDEFFVLCSSAEDEQPTCFEKYRSGRAKYEEER